MTKGQKQKLSLKGRMRKHLGLFIKIQILVMVLGFVILPIVAHNVYPDASEICNQSYTGPHSMDQPDWAESCERYEGYEYVMGDLLDPNENRYTGDREYTPAPRFTGGTTTELNFHLFVLCPIIFYVLLLVRNSEKSDDKEMYFIYWNVIFCSIIILINTLSIINNMETLPKLEDYEKGRLEARDLLTDWNDARAFNSLLPSLSWLFVMAPVSFLCRLGVGLNKPEEEKFTLQGIITDSAAFNLGMWSFLIGWLVAIGIDLACGTFLIFVLPIFSLFHLGANMGFPPLNHEWIKCRSCRADFAVRTTTSGLNVVIADRDNPNTFRCKDCKKY